MIEHIRTIRGDCQLEESASKGVARLDDREDAPRRQIDPF
jgi:hypothetical protein